MLSDRSGRLRDLALFAAAALVPAAAVGVLGLRALSNEAAGARREVGLELAAAAAEMTRSMDQARARAAEGLSTLEPRGTTEELTAAIARLAPPFAEPVLIAGGQVISVGAPEPPETPRGAPSAPEGCEALAGALATPAVGGHREARREVLARCAEARGPTGRWIWPLVALDALDGRNEEVQREEVAGLPDAIAAWLEAHRGALEAPERRATTLEVEARLEGEARGRALATLAEPPRSAARRGALQRELAKAPAVAAIAAPPDARRFVTWRAGSSTAVMRAFGDARGEGRDGRLAGFVIHEGAIEGWLARDARAAPPGTVARLAHPGRASSVDGSAKGSTSASVGAGAPPIATVEIAPELAIELSPADPEAVAQKAARGERLLLGVGAAATALAVALAAALFARMRAARRSSALRTDFVAAVSHELRTPIASVRMLAELLEEGRLAPEEHGEVFSALGREARRLGETVERLLGFSRALAGRAPAERAPQRVAPAVAASIDTFEERNPDAPRVVRELDPAIEARIDAGQIQLAVDNLLANARKYAPLGAPYRVSVARARRGVAIRVEDRGPGVARRDQRRIFEPFERADDRLSRATEGSGIGLSLVRHVARAHGGRARVDSKPGCGAVFTVWIPASPEDVATRRATPIEEEQQR